MPRVRFAILILAVLAAAGATVWLAGRAGLQGGTALWTLPPLIAAAIVMFIARRR